MIVSTSSRRRAGYVLAAFVCGATTAQAQGGNERLSARIDSMAAAELSNGPIASLAIGVAQQGKVILARGYGHADFEHRVPATAETVYRIGSITKQFTGVAIMQLIERGRLSLDDPLTKFLPDYPTQGHRVTVRHLLTHTSGIKSYTGLGAEYWTKEFRLDLSDEKLIDLFENEPFDFAPGEKYRYNNSGFYLLGVIVEKVTGQPYREYVEQHVFGAAGMRSSYYCDETRIVKNRAEGYAVNDGKLVNDQPLSMHVPGAAGALCSTVRDLIQWERALNGEGVLRRASYEQMTTPAVLNDGTATEYGFGLRVSEQDGHRKFSHGGGIHGFVTMLGYYPDDDLTVVVLANTETEAPGKLESQIARWVLAEQRAIP